MWLFQLGFAVLLTSEIKQYVICSYWVIRLQIDNTCIGINHYY